MSKKKTQTRDKTAKQLSTAKPVTEEQVDGFPIVGIGASAGGLQALRTLIESMPDEPGVALVIVQHLDPTRKSLTPELLAKSTKMEVTQVADDPHVKPNRVYVIPPNKYLSISEGKLHLTAPEQPRGARMAIDHFLRSLAASHANCAVGVILSGTGADGTLGVKAIKAAGGLVIAQDPKTAEHDGMPRSAIDAGVVDHILAPAAIPEVLVRYAQHPYVREGGGAPLVERDGTAQDRAPGQITDGLKGIMSLLRAHGKHDFRNYKENTLIRRTGRRMCLHHLEHYEQYFDYLRTHPQEIDALVKDLLISVTDFFRDGEAWNDLADLVIAPLVTSKETDDPIRVWVAGCATGEEPYSVAILILEAMKQQEKHCALQVFASDIDRTALDYARAGRYPLTIEADVTAARLARFFVHSKDDDNHYRVNKTLREAVVFADQNLISDPPFSKLDLICCRNLLIYLKPEMQEKVLRLFHFSLRQDGFLFLGSSETVGRGSDLFASLSLESRIFRRKGTTRYDLVEIPLAPSSQHREHRPTQPAGDRPETRLVQLTQQQLLDMLAPRAVVINSDRQIVHICGDVDPYLRHVPGAPTNDLLDKTRHGLRTRLRGAIYKMFTDNQPVSVTARVQRNGIYYPLRIEVRPLYDPDQEQDLAIIVFEEEHAAGTGLGASSRDSEPGLSEFKLRGKAEKPAGDATGPDSSTRSQGTTDVEFDDHTVIRQMEIELAATKQDLQTTVEQYETSNEEFKASNEEVMSINEELQSTNEELETSKEELQSLNEEISTVNNQLAAKVSELETKHDDLQNLLHESHLATICLNTKLHIRWFSSQATELVRITGADIGRPISDFAHAFLDGDIAHVAGHVLDRLAPDEREVAASHDRWFLRRTTPYRTEDHRIGGVLITFIDITARKQAEEALRAAHELSEKIIDTIREATLVLDVELRVVSANESFYRTFGVTHSGTVGRRIFELNDNQWDIPELRRLLESVLPSNQSFNDFEVEHDFESIGRRVLLLNGRQIEDIQLILLAIEDITELRLAERRRGFLLELNDSFRGEDNARSILNKAAVRLCNFFGCGHTLFLQLSHDREPKPADPSSVRAPRATILAQHSEGGKMLPEEFPLSPFTPDALSLLDRNEDLVVEDISQDPCFKGESPDVLIAMNMRALVAIPRLDGDRAESLLLVARPNRRKWNREEVALIRDVSERTWSAAHAAGADRALRESEERLRRAAAATGFGTYDYDVLSRQTIWSPELYTIACVPPNVPPDDQMMIDLIHPDDRELFIGGKRSALDPAGLGKHEMEFRLVCPDGSTRWVHDTGQTLFAGDGDARHATRVVGTVRDITEGKRAEHELHRLNATLERQVTQRTEMLAMLQDVTRKANEARTVEEAMLAALERICQYNGWQLGLAWQSPDDDSGQMVNTSWYAATKATAAVARLDEFRQICQQQRFARGEGLIGKVLESGKPKWIDDIARFDDWRRGTAEQLGLHAAIAFPVPVDGEVVAVLEFFSDHPARREVRFMEIMPDVGIQLGHVIERKRLERETVDAAEREQRRIGADIHDGVGQELTGLRYLAQTHLEALTRQSHPDLPIAQRIVQGFEAIQKQLRTIIRDLVPVEVDQHGLVSALRTLAARTSEAYDMACAFECEKPLAIENNLLATHIYRIAQEAVNNAVRHAQAEHITIRLSSQDGELDLHVADDGQGIGPDPFKRAGIGLRGMRFRAELIGAALRIAARAEGGTAVVCKVPIDETEDTGAEP